MSRLCVCTRVCVCFKGGHTSGVCHPKRRRSSEPSGELKEPEYADKYKTPGVCGCLRAYVPQVCEGGCEKKELRANIDPGSRRASVRARACVSDHISRA